MRFYIRSIPPKTRLEIYEIEMFEEIFVDPSPIPTVDLGKTEDKRLTFERFVQWQRLALIHSSLSPESLKRRTTRESTQNRKDMKEFNVICTDIKLSYVRNINVLISCIDVLFQCDRSPKPPFLIPSPTIYQPLIFTCFWRYTFKKQPVNCHVRSFFFSKASVQRGR